MKGLSYFDRRALLVVAWLSFGSHLLTAGPNLDAVWAPVDSIPAAARKGAIPWVRPAVFRGVRLNRVALQSVLAVVPPERLGAESGDGQEVKLPMPDGTLARFRCVESPVMAPELAARYPEIKTYLGVGIDDVAASVRFDVTPAGFHAQILSPQGTVYIDPLWRDDVTEYASYYRRDSGRTPDGWMCYGGLSPERTADARRNPPEIARRPVAGAHLRTFHLAVAATGEYTAFHGGTVEAGLAAIVTAVNRVDGVYENELAVRLVLVGNNDSVVYTDSATDPYTNDDLNTLITQNQANLDAVIGDDNYDIGHVFGTGPGGLAYLEVFCWSGYKAGGATGSAAPTGDDFYIDYVAHELGHQFGARHTFNGNTRSCGGSSRDAGTAYEPGSGSTIMAYAGICGADNLQAHSDPWFHFASQAEIQASIQSWGDCASVTATGNQSPDVEAGPSYTIPQGTPFALTAVGTDQDNDPLTFCWEERDLGPAQALSDPDNGSSPLFRSFPPTTNPTRVFPKLAALLSNTPSSGERLPVLGRTLRFSVTARDNRLGGGGVAVDEVDLLIDGNSGPFTVTSPNTAVTWSGTQTVTWDVAGTAGAPVNATTVTILLSTDGGNTFPTVLVAATPNDGSQTVVLPTLGTTTARVKVQADGNVFFDLSDEDFTITTPPTAAGLAYFHAGALVGGGVDLTWSTLVEVRTLGFRVERSSGVGVWECVAPEAIPALGSDQRPHVYGLKDTGGAGSPMAKYRLIEVDLSGQESIVAETEISPPLSLSIARAGTQLDLHLRGEPSGRVIVESSTTPGGPWSTVARVFLDASGAATMGLEADSEDPVRFYRLLAE